MQERAFGRRREDAAPFATARADRDDELNLVDLWLVVHRRWPWLLAGLLAGVMAGAAYPMVALATYESRASIYIGKVANLGLESPDVVAAQLLERYGRQSGQRGDVPYLKEVTKPSRQSELLSLVAVARLPGAAKDFLAQIVSNVMQRHEQMFQATIDPLRQRLESIEERIGLLRAQSTELGELVVRLRESDPSQAAVLAIERGALYPEISQLERDRLDLQQQTSRPRSEPSKVIADAVLAIRPVAPRYSTSMAIGVVIGLALGVLAVFLIEFFAIIDAKTQSDSRSSKRARG